MLECYLAAAAIGTFLGLLATLAETTRRPGPALINVGIGIVGAVSMAWFLEPLAADQASRQVSPPEIAGALFGGAVLLVLFKAISR